MICCRDHFYAVKTILKIDMGLYIFFNALVPLPVMARSYIRTYRSLFSDSNVTFVTDIICSTKNKIFQLNQVLEVAKMIIMEVFLKIALSTVSLLILCPTRSSSAPLSERIMEPCGGSRTSNTQLVLTTMPQKTSEFAQIQILQAKSTQIFNESKTLKDSFYAERINDQDLQSLLDNISSLERFPKIPSTPSEPKRFLQYLKDCYKETSAAVVFVERMLTDETRESITSTSSRRISFFTEYGKLKENLYTFLCQLNMAVKNFDSRIDNFADTDTIDKSLRSLSTTERFNRDYIILRDVTRLFNYFTKCFTERTCFVL